MHGLPQDCYPLTGVCTLRENSFSLLQQLSFPNRSSVRGKTSCLPPFSRLGLAEAGFMYTVGCLHNHCEVMWHRCPTWGQASCTFLFSVPWLFMALWHIFIMFQPLKATASISDKRINLRDTMLRKPGTKRKILHKLMLMWKLKTRAKIIGIKSWMVDEKREKK